MNAADMSKTDFACSLGGNPYFRATFNISYDASTSTLELIPANPVSFNKLRYIYFGSSSQNEPNLCSADVFKYKVDNPSDVDLTKSAVSFGISHKPGTLPPLTVSVSLIDQGILNIQWTY